MAFQGGWQCHLFPTGHLPVPLLFVADFITFPDYCEKQLFLNNYSVGRGGREGTGRQAGPSEFRPWALVVDGENQLWEVVR